MKGLPTGYNKDLQEDKEAVFESEYTLAVALRAAHAVVSKLTVNRERWAARRRGCCWPLTSPTIWRPMACPSGAPMKSSARWCGRCWRRGATSAT